MVGIHVFPFTVKPTARLVADGNLLRRIWHWWQIRSAMRYVIHAERILEPRDGQIEAKGTTVDPEKFMLPLSHLLLQLADHHRSMMLTSLREFGAKLCHEKQAEPAVALWRKGTGLAPQDVGLWSNLGAGYADLSHNDDAVAAYQRAIELDPRYHAAYTGLGNVCVTRGEYIRAIELYQKAIELDTTDHSRAIDYNNLGNVYHELGRLDDALAAYERAIRTDPGNAVSYYSKARINFLRNEVVNASEMLMKAAELNPAAIQWAAEDVSLELLVKEPAFLQFLQGSAMYCVKCRTKRYDRYAIRITMKNGKPAVKGRCPICGTGMYKIGG